MTRLLELWEYQHYGLLAGVAIGTICSLLSVIVVLKRMAFIGEGIAHAGFGGMGTALFLGLTGAGAGGTWKTDLVVLAFCLATAVVIGLLSRHRHVEADSAIGIMLVAAMAWGVLMPDLQRNLQSTEWYSRLFGPARATADLESLLFGSLQSVGPYDFWLAVGVTLVVLLLLTAFFKEIIFYAFEETVSRVFGVPTGFIHYLILTLLSLTIVLTARLAGIMLVSALLVIPGATANLLSRRLGRVLLLSWLIGTAGVVGGLVLSVAAGNLSTGPCIVAVLCCLFALAYGVQPIRRGRKVQATA